jgi:transposase
MALNADGAIELMVANPRAVSDFSKALLQRSKTDTLDAQVIVEFVRRMPFVRWQAPSVAKLNLRALMRRIVALKTTRTQELNRLHASSRAGEITSSIRRDLQLGVRQIDRRIEKLERAPLSTQMVSSADVVTT